ncbi:MAG: hypothetical protein JWR69_3618 [Pedosphaera sp.]|nr:hypothetical protein [Pedosphaera sp.]
MPTGQFTNASGHPPRRAVFRRYVAARFQRASEGCILLPVKAAAGQSRRQSRPRAVFHGNRLSKADFCPANEALTDSTLGAYSYKLPPTKKP